MMNAKLSHLVPILLALVFGPARAQPVALVISNSNYAALPKLPTCQLSANLAAAVLTRAGFKVSRQSDLSNARLGTAIAALGDEAAAAQGGRAIIYLCSYAVSYADRLFILPAEVRLDRESDVLSQGIVARLLMSSVAGPGSAAGLVLMDVAPPPGKPALDFASMTRPADAAHGGLIAVTLPTTDAPGPAPLAAALSDVVGPGDVEVSALMATLASQPAVKRALSAFRPPTEPSLLVGASPTPPPPAPTPTPDVPASMPTPAAPPAPSATPPLPQAPQAATPTPAPDGPAPTSLAEPNGADRRRLQLALSRLGYYRGPVDGVFAAGTVLAIKQFQRDSDAEPTGKLTNKQVEQLLQ